MAIQPTLDFLPSGGATPALQTGDRVVGPRRGILGAGHPGVALVRRRPRIDHRETAAGKPAEVARRDAGASCQCGRRDQRVKFLDRIAGLPPREHNLRIARGCCRRERQQA